MKTHMALAFSLAFVVASVCYAKDHSNDYKMGTLSKVPLHVGGKVSQGYTDTTSCNSGLLGVHCTGGIVDDYSGWLVADIPNGTEVVIERCVGGSSMAALLLPCDRPYILELTEEEGTIVFLDKVLGSRDSSKGLETTSKVLYRIEHKPGVTYIKIPDPSNPDKEGSYTPIKLPKLKSDEKTVTAPDNVTAMCTSGRLSDELRAKYCTQPNPSAPQQQ